MMMNGLLKSMKHSLPRQIDVLIIFLAEGKVFLPLLRILKQQDAGRISVNGKPHRDFIQAAPYLIGIAVYEVLKRILLPELQAFLSLKWPNDLLWQGRKISGILIESAFESEVVNIVVGIGLNIVQSPKIPGRVLTSIRETGSPLITPEALAKNILTESKKWFSCWKIGRFPAIRREWLSRTCPKGTILEVGGGKSPVKGRFVGITDLGHLMIEDHNQKIKCLVTTEMR
ncbi:biotin operon repressor biotin--like protein [Lasius niger]|uniref:Biotin operon repressor biotin--like protein n=1 Tax=Lasius niger TaxID=67767 RepID=A0A0J7K573_LASNI|nr:biotin operon repressor biotin--like protein [Lasius niger]